MLLEKRLPKHIVASHNTLPTRDLAWKLQPSNHSYLEIMMGKWHLFQQVVPKWIVFLQFYSLGVHTEIKWNQMESDHTLLIRIKTVVILSFSPKYLQVHLSWYLFHNKNTVRIGETSCYILDISVLNISVEFKSSLRAQIYAFRFHH